MDCLHGLLDCLGLIVYRIQGSRTLRPRDISAPGHFGTNFKPNHRWICVLSELSLVQSVPTYRRSDAEVSRATFFVQKCLETVQKCLVRVRSVLVPKCFVAEVSVSFLSGNVRSRLSWQVISSGRRGLIKQLGAKHNEPHYILSR